MIITQFNEDYDSTILHDEWFCNLEAEKDSDGYYAVVTVGSYSNPEVTFKIYESYLNDFKSQIQDNNCNFDKDNDLYVMYHGIALNKETLNRVYSLLSMKKFDNGLINFSEYLDTTLF